MMKTVIKNPISLARTLLDFSTRELSLRRVPPNLLVGQGAIDFAYQQGVPVVDNDVMVSPAARERWLRWKSDLRTAGKRSHRKSGNGNANHDHSRAVNGTDPPPQYEEQVPKQLKRSHSQTAKHTISSEEGQLISPPSSTDPVHTRKAHDSSSSLSIGSQITPSTPITPEPSDVGVASLDPFTAPLTAENLARNARVGKISVNSIERRQSDGQETGQGNDEDMTDVDEDYPPDSDMDYNSSEQDLLDDDDRMSLPSTLKLPSLPSLTPSPRSTAATRTTAPSSPRLDPIPSMTSNVDGTDSGLPGHSRPAQTGEPVTDEDFVVDTVGAIAIDNEGNIACGASSGGIGMKFRGRVGPAALVGIGAAVVPVDADDKSRMSTAAVASGTGEHMATTLASRICAERLYHGQRKRRGGGCEKVDEHEVVRNMVELDFMG